MTCPDCDMAAQQLHHGFRSACQGCAARALVRSPVFRTAMSPTGFGWHDRKLQQLCEFYKVSREQVQHAAEMDAKHKEMA